jgi:type IV pilus assembly protein PilM
MFIFGKTYPIGLDVSDLSLKLIQLSKQRKNIFGKADYIKIQALGKASLKPGLIENGDIIDIDQVAVEIKKLIEKVKFGKVNSSDVVACLPETKTFIKLIEVDSGPNELLDVIEKEIERHVPMLLNDIYYDWQVIEENEKSKKVLIGAAPRKTVDQYTELIHKAGLSISALEIEPISISRSLLVEESGYYRGNRKENYAIIDIGASRTSMIFYSKNTILFTSKIPISGEKITEEIADNLVIEKEQAEKVKIICGLDKKKVNGIIYKILLGTIKDLSEKIKEAIDFYDNHFSRGTIKKIYLSGGGSNIKGIDTIINEVTGIEVVKGDSLINVHGDKEEILRILSETYNVSLDFNKISKSKINKTVNNKKISITQNSSSSFATAIGLALRGVYLTDL